MWLQRNAGFQSPNHPSKPPIGGGRLNEKVAAHVCNKARLRKFVLEHVVQEAGEVRVQALVPGDELVGEAQARHEAPFLQPVDGALIPGLSHGDSPVFFISLHTSSCC